MSLRIDSQLGADGAVTLRVSGRLAGAYVGELERAFALAAVSGAPPAVDLSDMTFASDDGIAALRRFLAVGAEVRACPTFLLPRLHGEVSHDR